MMRTPRSTAFLPLLALLASQAFAASNLKVASVGDGAPDGGVFAGPSFSGAWPSAAGSGWIVFRSTLEGGSASEAIIAAHQTAPTTRVQIARIGQKVDGAGSLRDFYGSPSIDAGGDVAFFANYRRDDGTQHVGLFFYDHAAPVSVDPLHRVVDDGDSTDLGVLDFDARVELDVDPTDDDTPDRIPGLNGNGAIAFVAGTVDQNVGIFRYTPGAGVSVIVRKGDPFDDGAFVGFGAPAMNAAGTIAFRATTDGPNATDGVFVANGSGVTQRVATGRGVSATQADASTYAGTLQQFGNSLSINASGDVAFTAGLLPAAGDPEAPTPEYAVCVLHGGSVSMVAFRNQALSLGRVTSVRLGANGGSRLPAPAIGDDGSVAFSVEISDGAIEALRQVKPPYGLNNTTTPVIFAGLNASPDPTGGKYRAITSAPAVDGTGAITFVGRMAGGTSSEAVVYLPTAGSPSVITQGEPSPTTGSGYFSGPAFSGPTITDAGDVIYKAFVARGRTSVGIFKTHFDRDSSGQLTRTTTRLVGANDLIPGGGGTILDIVSDPDVSGNGTVAFTALVDNDHGRGVFRILADGTLSLVADRTISGPDGVTFSSVGTPSINRGGTVAFRSSVRSSTPNVPSTEGIYLFDGTTFTTQVLDGDATTGGNFTRLRDAGISGVPSVAFRADVQSDPSGPTKGGLFLDAGGAVATIALQGDEIGNGVTIDDFSGTPSLSDDGDLAFLVLRTRDGVSLGSGLLVRRSNDLGQVVAVGDPGPMGGSFKSISAPVMAPKGRVAFRGSIEGGPAGGIFVNGDSGIRPYALINDASPIGGRYSSFGTKVSLNASDAIAFTANVSGGDARSGVFVASPTILVAPVFNLKLSGGQKRDRLVLALTLALGQITDDVDPVKEAITVTIGDGSGTLTAIKIPAGTLARRGKRFVLASGKTLPAGVRALKIVAGRRKTYRVVLKTGPLDLTAGGTRRISTPLSATVEIGDDAGTFIADCQLRLNGAHCGNK